MELETEFIAAHRLGYLDTGQLDAGLGATKELGRMLAGLMRRLRHQP
jgi:hypothetical protein